MNLSTRLMGFHLAVAKNSPLLGRPCKGTRSRGREPRAGLPAFRADRRRLRELAEAEDLNPADETSRAQDRVVIRNVSIKSEEKRRNFPTSCCLGKTQCEPRPR